VGPVTAVVAIPLGLADAASVIFLVFLAGGAFAVVDATGALRSGVRWLVARLKHSDILVIPIVCVLFATAGALENMQEEIIALVPVLLVLTRTLGYDNLTAAAMSLGAAAVGAAFSPVNPFQVGIAQRLAELPLLTGAGLRILFLLAALAWWIAGTMRYAAKTRGVKDVDAADGETGPHGIRHVGVVLIVLLAFAVFVYGVLRLGWDFNQMSAVFFAMGIAAGLIGGLGLGGTAEAFVEGFKSMAYAGLLIGFARAIYVVLDQGSIIDTLVHGMFAPIAGLPTLLSAAGMMVVQTAVHVPVPSVSGQAVLTMPILTPLADLLHLPRDVTVLAYQFGAGLCDLVTPTNGALMAVLAAAGVRYERWLRFMVPMYLGLAVLAVVALAVGIAIGLP